MTMNNNFNQPMMENMSNELIGMTTDIVSHYVSNNSIDTADLQKLIKQVYTSLSELGGAPSLTLDRPEPAVPIKKSIHDDHIVCLEDGKKLKMLKRHLKTAFNMTPEQYRERWNLPSDYPMVAPNYAQQRSSLARQIGLGRKRKVDTKAVAA